MSFLTRLVVAIVCGVLLRVIVGLPLTHGPTDSVIRLAIGLLALYEVYFVFWCAVMALSYTEDLWPSPKPVRYTDDDDNGGGPEPDDLPTIDPQEWWRRMPRSPNGPTKPTDDGPQPDVERESTGVQRTIADAERIVERSIRRKYDAEKQAMRETRKRSFTKHYD